MARPQIYYETIAYDELFGAGNWVKEANGTLVYDTAAFPNITQTDIDAKIAEVQTRVDDEDAKHEAKLVGADYNGYMVSLTNEDAMALLQVKAAFDMGITNTNIYFANGTVLPMTPTEFGDFSAWFVQQRNNFFI